MKSKRWPLVALAALFFGPFIVAVVLYAARDSFGGFALIPNPDRELIGDPVVLPLEPLRLAAGGATEAAWSRSQWSLIYARIPACREDCQAALTRLHQVYLTLGGDRDRVQQILLLPANETPVRAPPDFLVGLLDAPDGPDLIRLFGRERLEEGRYFVVDPLGNLILSYPDDADQGRLLEDLERLLDASRVG